MRQSEVKQALRDGRQIGAYPILVGAEYLIPLETTSDIIVTGHGARSITGVECSLNFDTVSEKQLAAIPGIGNKSAWKLIGERVEAEGKDPTKSFADTQTWFAAAGFTWQDELAKYFSP